MPDNLRNTLVRVYTCDMRRNVGNVVVAEINFRRVEMPTAVAGTSAGRTSVRGAVLIDNTGSLGPIADLVRRTVGFLVFIRATDELLWCPVKADMMAGDYWTVEMVPWIDYLRAASLPDENIIRKAHSAE
jgi:hypothetical protein